MPLPKSLVQPYRQGQLTVGSGYRAYFAPFNQALAVNQSSTQYGPTVYDLMVTGKFIEFPSPPAGWFDLGFIDKFKFTPGSKIGSVKSGYRMAIRAKYRGEVNEKASMSFREMSSMAYKISTGAQVFNLLATTVTTPSTLGPLSSSGTTAIPMGASGYLATGAPSGPTSGLPTLFVPAGSGSLFPAGSYIVCDQDYQNGTFGFVGDAGANLFPGITVGVDFIRQTSDYVSGVLQVIPNAETGQDALILTGPFIGGGNQATLGVTPNTAPTTGAKIQAIKGYTSREGGTYIKEWSGIFILDTIDGSQLLFYYPRLSPDQYSGLDTIALDGATSETTMANNTSFDAMAFDDPLDGETVVRYSAYYPHNYQNIQI